MATMASAQAKYERKTGPGSSAVAKYNAAKGRMVSNYASGLTSFLGSAPSNLVVQSYRAGIEAAVYRGGDSEKWARNLRAALTGG